MKSNLAILFAMIIGVAIGAHAQAAIEYSHVASGSTGAVAGASKTLGTAGNRVAGKLAAADKSVGSDSSRVAVVNKTSAKGIVAADKAAAAPPSLSKSDPPAIFVLSNGQRIESRNYFLTVDSVRIDDSDMPRTIPMSNLNVDATLSANRERGLNLKIPDNKAQIMVSF